MNDTQDSIQDAQQDKAPALQTGEDVALAALSQSSQQTPSLSDGSTDSTSESDEVAASNEIGETILTLQNLIERHANQMDQIDEKLKEYREQLRNVFENDTELSVAQDQAEQFTSQVKERKAKLQTDPQVTQFKSKIGELNEQKKEIKETLSNHLVNFYSLTNSTSFDTSDGDQREFSISARVKSKRKKKD